jgi:hypothetical protein
MGLFITTFLLYRELLFQHISISLKENLFNFIIFAKEKDDS